MWTWYPGASMQPPRCVGQDRSRQDRCPIQRRVLYGGGRTEIRSPGPQSADGQTEGRGVTGLAIRTFLTMLVVIDPIGLVPMFLALAGDRDAAEQRRIALRAILVAAGILVSFGLGGAWLMGWLGISLDAFRVAGGVLLFLTGESKAYPLGFVLVLAMTGFVLLLGHMALIVSQPIGRLLGRTGVNVVTRVLGVLLAALAAQYVADGVRGFLA